MGFYMGYFSKYEFYGFFLKILEKRKKNMGCGRSVNRAAFVTKHLITS